MKHILVVDDDRASCDLLCEIFAAQGWEAQAAQTPARALELMDGFCPDLVVSDINLEAEQSGFDLLRQFRSRCPVVLVTGFGTLDAAVEASHEGAWDFISKPFKVEEVVATVRRALGREAATAGGALESLAHEDLTARYREAGLTGRAPSMIELYKEIARVAPSRSTVLVTGESGTGKELVARAIHKHSARAGKSFVAVNCGALTETLLEAELFGHARGAFTGAIAERRGLWEEAAGGTIFLDEIGEMSPSMQVKLLRVLQQGEVKRVGSAQTVRVDTRVVAATNRDLERDVKAGNFREDLFYRLSVVNMRVPPLRERRSDIPLLAEHFLRAASEKNVQGQHQRSSQRSSQRLSEATLRRLLAYEWPGNVRELESAIEYASLHARGAEVEPEDLPARLQTAEVRAGARSTLAHLYEDLPALDELERRYLLHVLKVLDGNRTRAAEVLKIDRRTLYRMAERFGIELRED